MSRFGRTEPGSPGGAILLGLLLATAVSAGAENESALAVAEPLDLRFQTLDLEYRTEDVAGATRALEVEETETEIRIELSGDVLFDFDKADIRPVAEDPLGRVAEMIREHPGATVRIEGHTDSKGADDYNLRLSQRRADSVRDWLRRNGASEANYVTRGFGETKPTAPNEKPDGGDDPDGRQKNRRVEIVVRK